MPGETTASKDIVIESDNVLEYNEMFTMTLSITDAALNMVARVEEPISAEVIIKDRKCSVSLVEHKSNYELLDILQLATFQLFISNK